jgi:hypothetical protein
MGSTVQQTYRLGSERKDNVPVGNRRSAQTSTLTIQFNSDGFETDRNMIALAILNSQQKYTDLGRLPMNFRPLGPPHYLTVETSHCIDAQRRAPPAGDFVSAWA